MNTQHSVEQLFTQLTELDQLLGKLLDVLQQEQVALSQNDFAALEALAHDKEMISTQIEQIEKRRHTLCNQLNIECNFTGIKTYFDTVANMHAGRRNHSGTGSASLAVDAPVRTR